MEELDETQKPEGEPESLSSEEEQTSDNGSEAEKTSSGGNSVPYDRFKEVIDSRNEVMTDLGALRKEVEILRQKQSEEEEEEPLDWKEAQQKTIQKALSKMKEEQQKEAEEKAEQEKMIERRFEQLKGIGEEVTPEVRKAVLKQIIETGSDDVFEAYLQVREQTARTQKGAEIRKEGSVPTSRRGATATKSNLSYGQLRKTSLEEIIEGSS